MLTVGLFGTGRLGTAIASCIDATADVTCAWQVGMEPPPDQPVDVAIEATVATAVPQRLAWAQETRTPLVIGTTGWASPQALDAAAAVTGILVAPNFSLTVALMARFARVLGRFARLVPDRDLYLLEHHHRAKVDAPSGTARRLLEALGDLDNTAVAVLRAGANPGLHVVGFDSPSETLELRHQVHSRQVFGAGALVAARYLHGRCGVHTMDDLAASILDPLFVLE